MVMVCEQRGVEGCCATQGALVCLTVLLILLGQPVARSSPKDTDTRHCGAAATADGTNDDWDERGHAPAAAAAPSSSAARAPSQPHLSSSTPAKRCQRGAKKRRIGSDTPSTAPADTDDRPDSDSDDGGPCWYYR